MRAKWLVEIGSGILALGSGALYYIYPAETAKFISETFGISSYAAAVDIFLGTALLSGGIFITFAAVNILDFVRRQQPTSANGVSALASARANLSSQFWGYVLMSVMVGAFLGWFGYDLLPLALSSPSIGTYGVVIIPEAAAVILFVSLGWRVRKVLRADGQPKALPTPTASIAASTGVIPGVSENNEKQALERSTRGITDLLSRLKDLDMKKNPTLVTGLFDTLRQKLQDFPAPSVITWNMNARGVISQVIDLIDSLFPPKGLIGWEGRCIDWINLLNLKRDGPTHDLLKTRFLSKISLYMNDYRFEKNPTPLELFQDLNDYATEPMIGLVKAALDEGRIAIGDGWRDDRFKVMQTYISFEVMALRNHDGLREVRDYLWSQMKQYERPDLVRFEKAKVLYDRAERSLTT